MAKNIKDISYLVDNLKQSTRSSKALVDEDGSMTFDFESDDEFESFNNSGTDPEYTKELTEGHYRNLVDEIDSDILKEISKCVLDAVSTDENSRADNMRDLELGLNLIGIKIEEKNEPFQGACSAQHPLLMD